MTVAIAKWTLDDYHQMIQVGLLEGRSVELLKGAIIEMSPENPEHAQKSANAADYLRTLLGSRPLIREAKPITLSEMMGLKPHPDPDDIYWLIEYTNTSLEKDLNSKRDTYTKSGILDHWIVDLKHQCGCFPILKKGTINQKTVSIKGQSVLQLFQILLLT